MGESIKTATMLGAQSANAKKRWLSMNVHTHAITDNPYDRKRRKKEHVAWHNAFYETRKRGAYKRLL